MKYLYQGKTYYSIEAVHHQATIDLVRWYIDRYPPKKTALYNLLDDKLYDGITEDDLQKVCNPSDYWSDPIVDCGADYL